MGSPKPPAFKKIFHFYSLILALFLLDPSENFSTDALMPTCLPQTVEASHCAFAERQSESCKLLFLK